MAFSAFTTLCSHHLRVGPPLPPPAPHGNPRQLSCCSPARPSPQPPTRLLSLDFPALDISHQCNHTVCRRLWLLSVASHPPGCRAVGPSLFSMASALPVCTRALLCVRIPRRVDPDAKRSGGSEPRCWEPVRACACSRPCFQICPRVSRLGSAGSW